ncbi:hypothetical protein C8R48DRAFT_668952 [Suillus tomentosus]|nr:hypothetical protein C8R48DRAFT_668952 [Suillus tomentosus]
MVSCMSGQQFCKSNPFCAYGVNSRVVSDGVDNTCSCEDERECDCRIWLLGTTWNWGACWLSRSTREQINEIGDSEDISWRTKNECSVASKDIQQGAHSITHSGQWSGKRVRTGSMIDREQRVMPDICQGRLLATSKVLHIAFSPYAHHNVERKPDLHADSINLDSLPDLLACLGSSEDVHDMGTAMAVRRFDQIVNPFFGAHFAEMRHLLHITSTLITGSCARRMLTGQGAMPKDLNLVTGSGSAEVLYSFLTGDLRYKRHNFVHVNYAFAEKVKTFATFRKGPWVVTVSEAKGDDLFEVVASSPTTGDMAVMTPGGLVLFYPLWTLSGTTVMNGHIMSDGKEGCGRTRQQTNVGCMVKDEFRVEATTDFLGKECGPACPTLWRNVWDDGGQMLVLEWDERFSIKSAIQRSQTIWRLAVDCQNSCCAYNPKNNSRSVRLPPQPTPSILSEIEVQEARIAQHWPDYQGILQGVLYATRADAAHLVSIPLRDGVESLVDISQLEVTHWVDQLGPDKFVTSSGRCRKTYNVIADMPEGETPPGYTFFRDHPLVYGPPNALIRNIGGITANADDVEGNVLVVKHTRGKKNDLMDCEEDDIPWISGIIKQCVTLCP